MIKTIIATVGIILFLASLGLGLNLSQSEKKAHLLDHKKTIFAIIGEESPPVCEWDVKQPERVMSENKSQAILVQNSNSFDKECESFISLRAPGFDINPSKEEQKVNLPKKGKGSLSWIITPRKTGTFEIAVSDVTNTRIFGITVTNILGLSAAQVKLFSLIGSLFGPMFTIPWWLEKWLARKKKQNVAS